LSNLNTKPAELNFETRTFSYQKMGVCGSKSVRTKPKLLAGESRSDNPSDPLDADRARQLAAERVTPAKGGALLLLLALACFLSVEAFREGFRIYHSVGLEEPLPPSLFNAWLQAHAVSLTPSSPPCLPVSVGRCPFFEPLGECSRDTDAYLRAHGRSILVGHTVDEAAGSARLKARMLTNAIHLSGVCFIAWIGSALYMLGGGIRAETSLKKVPRTATSLRPRLRRDNLPARARAPRVAQLTPFTRALSARRLGVRTPHPLARLAAVPQVLVSVYTEVSWSMVVTGCLLLGWRRTTEFANFSPNLTAAWSEWVGLSGGAAAWHEVRPGG
jgi:hypothetical protein